MNNYNYIPESQPVLLTQVFPLVKTCKLPKEKAVRQKRRKLLVKPNNQPSLMDFLTKNRVNAYITSKRALDGDKTSNKKQKTSDKGNTSDTLPNNCSVNQRFALLFFLSSSPAISIKPIIILIDKTKLPTKKKEEKTYMKFRLNGHKEIGRLVALSETREALIKFVGEAISKFDKAKGKRFIKSNELVQSCLKESPFSVLDSKQIDGCLLYQMLDLQEDPFNLTPETTRNSTAIDEEPSPGPSDALNKPEESHAAGDENSNNDAEIILDPDSKEDEVVSDDQSDEIVGILSDDESATDASESEADDETEFQKGLASKDVLRPKSSTPNSQSGSGRMSKGDIYELNIKHDRKSEEERESRIQEAILRCNSLVLTLDEKASSTILIREMHGIIKDLAESLKFVKDKELSNKKVFEINKDLKVRKTNNKDELSLNGLVRFPLKAYGDAVTQPEAHRIVSWIFRKCIDEKIKEGAHMNKEHDYNHIAYKLGNARLLDFHERINDGFTVIDAIINHAHSLKSNEPYGYLSYKKCLRQIQKACYDYNKKKVSEATKDDEDDDNSSRSYSQPMPKGAKAKQIRKDNARDELERNAASQNHDAVESYE